jgi:hypothetical protein
MFSRPGCTTVFQPRFLDGLGAQRNSALRRRRALSLIRRPPAARENSSGSSERYSSSWMRPSYVWLLIMSRADISR